MNYSHKFNLQALRFISFYQQSIRGNLTFYTSPIEGGEGGKASWGRRKDQLELGIDHLCNSE